MFWGQHLAADYGLYAVFFARLIKIHGAVHIAVIRDGKSGHTQLLCAQNERLDTAGAVKQRIFCVQMEMGKHSYTSLKYYKQ